LVVQALEINRQGLKTPLSTWEVPPDELRRFWRNGLFSTGYSLTLPWKAWPSSDKLRVVVQFRLADGRVFEADKDITIHLTPPAQQRPLPAPESAPAPVRPNPVLPTPHPLDPSVPDAVSAQTAHFTPADPGQPTATSLWHKAVPPPPVEILRPVPME
jgi:hypothetical protein